MKSVLIISGWAHGVEAIQPMGDALADRFDVRLMTGAHVLDERRIPDSDYIVTGSMGGLLAMELLPESCKKLVLISSTAKFCAGEGYACGTPEKVLRRMILQLQRNPEAVLEEFFKNVHYPHKQSRRGILPRCDGTEDLVAGLEYLLASDVRGKVPNIGIPVLLLHGADDRIIPPSASGWLHKNLPDSQLKIFENDGHALPAHHFAAVMKELRAFLEPTCG
ncbi:MAG: alpha/beta hydrolase [Kiritimatiellales bacterium]|nr:alpha/beta hydrolase [Kiritimatiellales bacterium]